MLLVAKFSVRSFSANSHRYLRRSLGVDGVAKRKSPSALSPTGFSISLAPTSGCRSRDPSTSVAISNRLVSNGAKVFRAGLAAHAVGFGFERKLLAFIKRIHARTFDRADMNENVAAAVFRLNEAEALCRIEPFNCSDRHVFLQAAQRRVVRTMFMQT